jgi:anti-anti-sigma regulatory factor
LSSLAAAGKVGRWSFEMPIEKWSDQVSVIHLADDPQFTDDITALERQALAPKSAAVLDFGAVGMINSSNIAQLLLLRKRMAGVNCRLVLCNLNTQLWGALLVTGLDQIFDFSDNVTTALPTLQMV